MNHLAPHQQRVVDERRDLDEKLQKLSAFISSEKFLEIVQDEAERGRLVCQEETMRDYSAILGERIAAFRAALDAAHASTVLYPAIKSAMEELQSLRPGFNDAVDRAYNLLHDAFWSETPAPASEPAKRPLGAAAGVRTSEACAVGVLADLLGKEQHRARTYAAEADEARAAGLTCERAYDAARQALGQRGGKYGF